MSLFDQGIRSVEEPKKCKQRFAYTQQLYHLYGFLLLQWVGFRGLQQGRKLILTSLRSCVEASPVSFL